MIMSLRREDGSYTNSEIERAELLLRTHFPGSRVGNSGQPYSRPVNSGNQNRQIASHICTGDRIKWALSTFLRFKSPGTDGIFPVLLQRAIEELLPFLINIWLRARVVFIPKVWKK